jgi:hypothetical protein
MKRDLEVPQIYWGLQILLLGFTAVTLGRALGKTWRPQHKP